MEMGFFRNHLSPVYPTDEGGRFTLHFFYLLAFPNSYLTLKNIRMMKIILRWNKIKMKVNIWNYGALTLFLSGGYQIDTCLPFYLYLWHGFRSE